MGNTDEILSFVSRATNCDGVGFVQELIDWANKEENDEVYNALNTVIYTFVEHCSDNMA